MRRLELRHGKPSKHGFWELDVDAHVYTIREGDLRGRKKPEVEVRTCGSETAAAVEAKAKLEAKLRKGWVEVDVPRLEPLPPTDMLTRLRARHDVRAYAKFDEHEGVVTGVTLSIGGPYGWRGPTPGELLDALIHAPAGRSLTELRVVAGGDDHRSLVADLLTALGRGPTLPCLQRVSVERTEACWAYASIRVGGLDSVLRIAPALEVLRVAGGAIELDALSHPRLRELVLETDALAAETARAVANAELPECTRLVVYFGMSDLDVGCELADLGPLWTGAGVAKLAHLGLVNAPFDEVLVRTIAGAKLLARLETLDLSLGTLRDSAAAEIVAAADRFAHLRRLDLHGNFLSAGACASLQRVLPNVVVADQRDPYASSMVAPYYVNVGE